MRYLTFALGKGRLAKQTLELFEKIGITCEEMKDKDSRKNGRDSSKSIR
jgi:ATP phosphoribosyltransferase